jgi:hypothetical protein
MPKNLNLTYPALRTTRTLWRSREDGTGQEKAGTEEITFDVFIDMNAMLALARKAAGNKRSKAKHGPLEIHVTKRSPSTQITA